MQPPKAKKIPTSKMIHGNTHHDPYAWLQEKENAEVIAYLTAENDYTEAYMQSTHDLQEQLFQEITGRIQLKDTSVPYRWRDHFYYFRTQKEAQYPIFCRRSRDNLEREEILHNQNHAAKGKVYYHVGDYAVSLNNQKLAWTEDIDGSEYYDLFIKDLVSKRVHREFSLKIAGDIVWSLDSNMIFYSRYDDTHRPDSVWVHHLGDPSKADQCLFNEPDERFFVSIHRSVTDRFLVISLSSKETTEAHLIDLTKNVFTPQIIFPREEKIKYHVFDHGDDLYVLTNQDAKNFRLMKTTVVAPSKQTWQEIIPANDTIKLDDIDVFEHYLVVTERGMALQQLRVISLRDNATWLISFDEPCFDVSTLDNHEFCTDSLRFAYTSLSTPTQIIDYTFATREKLLLKKTPVLGQFDEKNYTSQRLFATAHDGVAIPISLVYKNDTPLNAETPLYLYGYGAYGISLDPWFSHARLSLLDRGFVFAIAHVRGGGDCGEAWHDQGKLHLKNNTFDDFIACAEFLIQHHFTSAQKMVISGGSAGGLLIGAVINKRPDLFAAAVADVPFVDCFNTMLDPTLPLTVHEYEEWGNPEALDAYQDIAGYAPYEQVTAQDYPALFITAGLHDPRVSYWEPAKWCAKLRDLKTDDHILLLKTDLTSGHGGPSGRFSAFREVVFEYAFLLKVLGIAI